MGERLRDSRLNWARGNERDALRSFGQRRNKLRVFLASVSLLAMLRVTVTRARVTRGKS
jgi:hypothetical protein